MKTLQFTFKVTAGLMLVLGVFTGCGTTDGGSASVSGSAYYGVGFSDPWYYGGYYPPDVIVTPPPPGGPPPGAPPVKPEQPIAKPPPAPAPAPRPLPSIPSTPMPRPAMRR